MFRIGIRDGGVVALTTDDYAYTDVTAAPGGVVYALRSSYAAPPHPVRIDPDGTVTALPCVDPPALPGSLTEITANATDGTAVRSWLVLPEDSDGSVPAPLLLWIHGGPLASWNAWHWRWNPWVLAARGYAVLLPDPALSTGYGQDFIQRGWGAWGGAPYDDLMAATDAACAHPRDRRRAHRRDGRLVRRLHGELDGRPHRPVRRDRHPRQPVGARPVRLRPPTPPTTGCAR